MAKRAAKKTYWVCHAAEVVGIDLHKCTLVRRELHVRGGCEYEIGEAVNTGRAFILRRVAKPTPPYTHLVSWPGTGLFLCRLVEGKQQTLAANGGSTP